MSTTEQQPPGITRIDLQAGFSVRNTRIRIPAGMVSRFWHLPLLAARRPSSVGGDGLGGDLNTLRFAFQRLSGQQ
jgi:hypothetical protein